MKREIAMYMYSTFNSIDAPGVKWKNVGLIVNTPTHNTPPPSFSRVISLKLPSPPLLRQGKVNNRRPPTKQWPHCSTDGTIGHKE